MKKNYPLLLSVLFSFIFISCASVPSTSRDRMLSLSGYSISETEFGGVERWYAVDLYNYESLIDEVRFQVGFFKNDNIGFILYGDGAIGEIAYFSRDGLDLRWDWGRKGKSFNYSFVIEPDGTGLYYDFSTSKDGTAKPRGLYKVRKF